MVNLLLRFVYFNASVTNDKALKYDGLCSINWNINESVAVQLFNRLYARNTHMLKHVYLCGVHVSDFNIMRNIKWIM